MYQNDFTKRIRGHFRALFFSVIVIFTLFLFFIPVANADNIGLPPGDFYNVSFNDYELGNLLGQFDWTSFDPVCSQIEQRGESYNKVLDLTGSECYAEKNFLGLVSDYDFLTIKVEIPVCPVDRYYGYSIILKDNNGDWFFTLNISKTSETQATIIVETISGGIVIDENFDYAGNYDWIIELDKMNKRFRVKNDFSDWSDWFETINGITPEIDFLKFRSYGNSYEGVKTYIDDIFLEAKHCGPLNCELCDTKDGCDYVDNCVWNLHKDICETRSIFTQCGPGVNLIFCETQDECEAVGGNWLNDKCWETAGVPLPDFLAFYQSRIDDYNFDEPTSMAWSMVAFVNPVFRTAGNIITTFENKFKIPEAHKYGFMFGGVIPKARGYMGTVNDFFGGLPVGETFLVFLLASISVSVIRIIFKTFGLIKP